MGDALGGTMRNLTGAAAGISFAKAIMDALRKKGVRHKIRQAHSGKIQQIAWPTRTLLFDRKPKFIDKTLIHTRTLAQETRRKLSFWMYAKATALAESLKVALIPLAPMSTGRRLTSLSTELERHSRLRVLFSFLRELRSNFQWQRKFSLN